VRQLPSSALDAIWRERRNGALRIPRAATSRYRARGARRGEEPKSEQGFWGFRLLRLRAVGCALSVARCRLRAVGCALSVAQGAFSGRASPEMRCTDSEALR